jgi:hypothetical protein
MDWLVTYNHCYISVSIVGMLYLFSSMVRLRVHEKRVGAEFTRCFANDIRVPIEMVRDTSRETCTNDAETH